MKWQPRLMVYITLLLLSISIMCLCYCYVIKTKARNEGKSFVRDYKEVRQEGILRLLAPTPIEMYLKQRGESLQALLHRLSERSVCEVHLEFEDNFQKALTLLDEGLVDLVLHSVLRTDCLDSAKYIWVREFISEPIRLVQRQDNSTHITRQLDLDKVTVVIPKVSPFRLFLEHLKDHLSIDIEMVEREESVEQLVKLVQSGEITYTLCSDEEALYYAEQFPELDFTLPLSHHLRGGWIARRKASVLSDSLRLWLKEE